jgi:hypothetical protein
MEALGTWCPGAEAVIERRSTRAIECARWSV